jgi:flavorubredoxin
LYQHAGRLARGAGGFNFNQHLIADDEPLVIHTEPRQMFSLVSEAIGKVLPLATLRYAALSHVEADEGGSRNEFLALAPSTMCGQLAAKVSMDDLADRPARALTDGEVAADHRTRNRSQ